jgi:replicative DNA helicase
MFVYREEYYVERRQPAEGTAEHATWQDEMSRAHNIAEVIIGKQRHGPIGTVKLYFDGQFTKFSDLDSRYEEH